MDKANVWSGGRSVSRTTLITDIEDYGAPYRTDASRFGLCPRLGQLLVSALISAGIEESQFDMHRRGDGWLVAIDAAVGKPSILGPAVDQLAAALREHNEDASLAERLRVRLALHAGDLLIDVRDGNLDGNVIVVASRLVDSEQVRILLREASGPLLVCVSDAVYQQVIAQRHEGLNPADYEPVWLDSKDAVRRRAWVRSPGESGVAARAGLRAADVKAHGPGGGRAPAGGSGLTRQGG